MNSYTFAKLSINIDGNYIIAEPKISYAISSDPGKTNYPVKYVVIYELNYKNGLGENILSYIPYYLSDGQTNNFRAGMLFPFMCFNDDSKNLNDCPVSESYNYGVLLKYHVAKNLDFRFIYKWINSKIVEKFGQRGVEFINSHLPSASQNGRIGVSSVLVRIENLLDFFIAIYSDRIINYNNYDINTYKPNFNNAFDYSAYSNPSVEHIYADIYNEYRRLHLIFLNDYIVNFQHYNIINYELVPLNFNLVTISQFNSLNFIKICSPTGILQDKKTNTLNYVNISGKLHNLILSIKDLYKTPQLFWNKYNYIQPHLFDNFFDHYKQFFSKFDYLIMDFKPNTNEPNNVLDKNIQNWNAVCKAFGGNKYFKKYLKYKLKYLELKNKNN